MISRGSLLHTGMIHGPGWSSKETGGEFFIALSDSYIEAGVEMVEVLLPTGPQAIAAYVFDVISEG